MPQTTANDENQRLAAHANTEQNCLAAKNATKPTPLHTNLPYHDQGPSSSTAQDPTSAVPSTSYLISSPESAPGLSGSSRTSSALESGPTTPEHSWAQSNAGFTLQQPESTAYRAEHYEDITSPSTISHIVPPTSPLASSSAVQDFAYDEAGPSRSQTTIRRVSSATANDVRREVPAGPSRLGWASVQNTPSEYYDESHWEEFRTRRGIPEARDDDGEQDDTTPRRMPPDLNQPYVDPDHDVSNTHRRSFFAHNEVDICHPNVMNRPWTEEEDLELRRRVSASRSYEEEVVHSDDSNVSPLDQRTITGQDQSSGVVPGSEEDGDDYERQPSPEALSLERHRDQEFARRIAREAMFAEISGNGLLDQRSIGPSWSYSSGPVLDEADPDAILPCPPGHAAEASDEVHSTGTGQRTPLSQDWNRLAALAMADDAAERADEALEQFNRFRDVAIDFGVRTNVAYEAVERFFSIQPRERREGMIGAFLRENETSPWLSVGTEWRMSQPNEGAFDPDVPGLLEAYMQLRGWMHDPISQERMCKYLRERLVMSQDYSYELLDCFRPCIDRSPPTRAEKIVSAMSTATNPKRAREKKRARATLSGEDPDAPSTASQTLRRISENFNNKVSSPLNKTIRNTTQKMGKTVRKVSDSLDNLFHEFKDPVEDPSKFCEYCDNHGHAQPACPLKRQHEIWARHNAQERAIKGMEASPGFFKNKNYDIVRLDKGPISEIMPDKVEANAQDENVSPHDNEAGQPPPRRSIPYESLEGYKEMCTGCDKYGVGKNHCDHPVESEAGPSKVDKGKGRARTAEDNHDDDAASLAPSSYGYPFGSFSERTTCPACQEPGHGIMHCETFHAANPDARQQWQDEGLEIRPDVDQPRGDGRRSKDKGKGRRRSEGSCRQQ